MKAAPITQFTSRTRRKPKASRIGAAVAFIAMEPTAATKVVRPERSGLMPKLICSMSGSTSGTAPTPIRNSEPPLTLQRKVRTFSSVRSMIGLRARRAWMT